MLSREDHIQMDRMRLDGTPPGRRGLLRGRGACARRGCLAPANAQQTPQGRQVQREALDSDPSPEAAGESGSAPVLALRSLRGT